MFTKLRLMLSTFWVLILRLWLLRTWLLVIVYCSAWIVGNSSRKEDRINGHPEVSNACITLERRHICFITVRLHFGLRFSWAALLAETRIIWSMQPGFFFLPQIRGEDSICASVTHISSHSQWLWRWRLLGVLPVTSLHSFPLPSRTTTRA